MSIDKSESNLKARVQTMMSKLGCSTQSTPVRTEHAQIRPSVATPVTPQSTSVMIGRKRPSTTPAAIHSKVTSTGSRSGIKSCGTSSERNLNVSHFVDVILKL